MARVVIPGVPHHITQRGIRRQPIFLDDDDRGLYTELILDSIVRYQVKIQAYCWMTNHIHLVAVPSAPDSLEKTFRRAHSIYARRFNTKHGFSGYLWQDRFHSCPLDEDHMWAALRYVEHNPVRAGMVAKAEDYPWSSAAAHCRGERDPLLGSFLTETRTPAEWFRWLAIANDTSFDKQIRASTASGIPCGDENFVRSVEGQVGRVLRLQKPGPKRQTEVA